MEDIKVIIYISMFIMFDFYLINCWNKNIYLKVNYPISFHIVKYTLIIRNVLLCLLILYKLFILIDKIRKNIFKMDL